MRFALSSVIVKACLSAREMRSMRVRAPVALPVMARVWPSMMLACSTTALRSCTNSVCADPFDLQRFVDKQVPAAFSAALAEIKAGRKQTHWSWWLFPTAPFVVDGKERGSATNRAFALRDRPPHGLTGEDAAAAFLARPPQPVRSGGAGEAAGGGGGTRTVHLRRNYIEMMTAVDDQLARGIPPLTLVGAADVGKLASSLRLFQRVSRPGGRHPDAAVHALCSRCLGRLEASVGGGADGGGAV